MVSTRIPKSDAKTLAVVKDELWGTVDFFRRRLGEGDCHDDHSAHAMGLQVSSWIYGEIMLARKLLHWPAITEAEEAATLAEAALKRDLEIASAWLREAT